MKASNKCKAYTSLEQSKKLADILLIESADMCFENEFPCWSLAALLSVLPFHLIVNNQGYAFSMHKGLNKNGETYKIRYNIFNTDVCLYATDYYNSPVDACYEMILKLHDLNLL